MGHSGCVRTSKAGPARSRISPTWQSLYVIAMAVACSSGSDDQAEGATTETTAQQDVEVSAEGTTIVSRGGSEVVNRFTGGSCASCHSAAEPQFDFVWLRRVG